MKTDPNETRSQTFFTSLQDEADLLEKELNKRSIFFKNEQQLVGWKTIQQQLKNNEAAIEFVSFPYYDGKRWTDTVYYAALIIRKTLPAPVFVSLFEKQALEKLLSNASFDSNKIKNTIYTPVGSDRPDTKTLYSLAWKPIEKYLTGINTVYFSLTGELHKISFAAIPVSSSQVLTDKYHLVQLNTTASIVNRASYTISSSDITCMYGGVIYSADSTQLKTVVAKYGSSPLVSRSAPEELFRGSGWNYLPGTAKEIEQIEQVCKQANFSVKTFSGINATEESVKTLDASSSPAILHIATHGFFFPNPSNEKADVFQEQFQSGKIFRKSENPLFRAGLLFAGANNA